MIYDKPDLIVIEIKSDDILLVSSTMEVHNIFDVDDEL
jgi:hypothetical protein